MSHGRLGAISPKQMDRYAAFSEGVHYAVQDMTKDTTVNELSIYLLYWEYFNVFTEKYEKGTVWK